MDSPCAPDAMHSALGEAASCAATCASDSAPSAASASTSATGPDVLCRFGALGFDLDHTLARYRLDEWMPWMYRMLLGHVVDVGGYPAWLLSHPFSRSATQKGLVWDSATGHVLKLGADKRVQAASHGWPQRMLSQAELAQTYPAPLEEFDGGRGPRFHPFTTFFEMPAAQIVALMVQAVDKGDAPPLPEGVPRDNKYGGVFRTLSAAFEWHLGSSERGDYFSAFSATPERFLQRRDGVARWLRRLRAGGKFLFLVTNSRLDYTENLARFSFGPDWRSLFDIVVVDARKPAWFMPTGTSTPAGPHQPRPFYFADQRTLTADFARPPATLDDLAVPHGLFVHGNAEQMQQLLERVWKERGFDAPPSVIYFGDHLHADCVATRAHTNWAAGAIVEEVEAAHDPPVGVTSPAAADGAQSLDSTNGACTATGCASKRKYETFRELPRRLARVIDNHPHAVFGSFFHHSPPSSNAALDSASEAQSHLNPSAPPDPSWSYWHQVLTHHCEVVVGCLTDFADEEQDEQLNLTVANPIAPPSNGTNNAHSAASPDPSSSSSAPVAAAVSPAPAVASPPMPPAPRLNSTCLHPPTLVRLSPPPLGSEFDAQHLPTPAQRADAQVAPVTMQYSVHRMPLSAKAELRGVFPDLSTNASGEPLTASQFKQLPLLAISTFQKANFPMLSVTPEVEAEKHRLLECFYAFSRRVCSRLQAQGAWADFIDPCSGYPVLGSHGSSTYSEVDAAALLLSYRMEQVGTCNVIDHPQWGMAHYPASILTTASLQHTLDAIALAQQELATKE